MVLPRTSPCDNFDCQNGAQCIIRINEPICQCLPGYQGQKCEKLVSVNFVNKESYLQIPSAKVRPQTNITLQVRFPHYQELISSEISSDSKHKCAWRFLSDVIS